MLNDGTIMRTGLTVLSRALHPGNADASLILLASSNFCPRSASGLGRYADMVGTRIRCTTRRASSFIRAKGKKCIDGQITD
jgi:hypothetical protein